MPKLFLIRHGQSVSNPLQIHQGVHDQLSDTGKLQAHALGKRLLAERIDEIYASHFVRAQETAQIVSAYLQKPVQTLECIGEVRNPSHFIGKHHEDPSIRLDHQLLDEHFSEDWHIQDEENFFDAKKRVHIFFAWVQSNMRHNTAVISHGNFIQYIMGVIQHKELYIPQKHKQTREETHLENTCITTIHVQHGAWDIENMFDASHLAQLNKKPVQ